MTSRFCGPLRDHTLPHLKPVSREGRYQDRNFVDDLALVEGVFEARGGAVYERPRPWWLHGVEGGEAGGGELFLLVWGG